MASMSPMWTCVADVQKLDDAVAVGGDAWACGGGGGWAIQKSVMVRAKRVYRNDPVEQEKAMKFNARLTIVVIFHNAMDIPEIVRQLREEGWEIDPEDLAHISPYLTEHEPVRRVLHARARHPAQAYDSKLDVDFTPLREQDPASARPPESAPDGSGRRH